MSAFEIGLAAVLAAMVVVLVALVLHLRALHRAIFQQAQVAYQGFMLNFFLALREMLREKPGQGSPAEGDLVWNLIEDYFRREAELYTTVIEELYDKTSMMHMMERGRIRREPPLGDPRPVEPLYQELHELLGRLREERRRREEAGAPARVDGPGDAA